MRNNHVSFAKRSVVTMLLAAAFAMLFITFAPHPAKAASNKTYLFTRDSVSKVKISGKKIKISGQPYNAKTYKRLAKGKYSFKINSSTKFRTLVSPETGKTKKIKKSSALKKLKKKKFISVHITATNKNVIKKIEFGAW